MRIAALWHHWRQNLTLQYWVRIDHERDIRILHHFQQEDQINTISSQPGFSDLAVQQVWEWLQLVLVAYPVPISRKEIKSQRLLQLNQSTWMQSSRCQCTSLPRTLLLQRVHLINLYLTEFLSLKISRSPLLLLFLSSPSSLLLIQSATWPTL